MNTKISASMMCANFCHLAEDVASLERGGIDLLHFDVMDAHFVPNLTLSPMIMKALRPLTDVPFDAHLQMTNPQDFIPAFVEAGSNIICLHLESSHSLHRLIHMIRDAGVEAAVAVNPMTPLTDVEYVLPLVRMVILMTVDPGFAGQHFVPEVLPKIRQLRERVERQGLDLDIAVDGNINETTVPLTKEAGANVFVAGTSSVFRPGADLVETTERFKSVCENAPSWHPPQKP